jgi:hypothetical protein
MFPKLYAKLIQTYLDSSFHPTHWNPLQKDENTLAILFNVYLDWINLAVDIRLKVNVSLDADQTHLNVLKL